MLGLKVNLRKRKTVAKEKSNDKIMLGDLMYEVLIMDKQAISLGNEGAIPGRMFNGDRVKRWAVIQREVNRRQCEHRIPPPSL